VQAALRKRNRLDEPGAREVDELVGAGSVTVTVTGGVAKFSDSLPAGKHSSE
jgi:hypothetical protein